MKNNKIGSVAVLFIMILFILVSENTSIHSTSAKGVSSNEQVTFSVNVLGEHIPKNPRFNIELHCGEKLVKKVRLSSNNESATYSQ